MKKIIRLFLISTVSLWLVNKLFPQGLILHGDYIMLMKVGAGLTLANLIVKPLFSLVMLPVNLMTFGLFRWVTNVAVLWVVAKFVGGISVRAFQFNGINYSGIIIPAIYFNQYTAWLAISFVIALISSLFIWITEK